MFQNCILLYKGCKGCQSVKGVNKNNIKIKGVSNYIYTHDNLGKRT